MVISCQTREVANISTPNDHSLKTDRRANKKRTKLDEAGFWDALGGDRRTNSAQQPEDDDKAGSPKQLENDVKEITGASNAREKNELRRESLLSMLHASEKRHKLATSRRPSVLAKGVEVMVSQGESAGETAVVLDADYINNRVLLSLNEQTEPQWLPFSHVDSSGKSDPHLAS